MRSNKDVSKTKWIFEVTDGPGEAEIVLLAIRKLLELGRLSVLAHFVLRINQPIWVPEKISAEIIELENIGNGQWSMLGRWTEAKFRERPLYFRTIYCPAKKIGTITFSFEYGKWPEQESDGAV